MYSGLLKVSFSSDGIATSYGTAWVLLPAGARKLSLVHSVQTGSGVHPASYPVGTGISSDGVKRRGREADLSPPIHLMPRSRMVEL
jgi:hypothetical protein